MIAPRGTSSLLVAFSALVTLALGACWDDDSPAAPADAGATDAATDAGLPTIDPSDELRLPGFAVVKLRVGAQGSVALVEKPTSCESMPALPVRQLRWFLHLSDADFYGSYVPAADEQLLDFALHPSGEVTAVAAGADAYRLLRFDASGTLRATTLLADPDAANDPFIDFSGPSAPPPLPGFAPRATVDAARLAPLGEDVAVVTRTGIDTVVAFGYDIESSGTLTRRFRTVIEAGIVLIPVGISGATAGTVDTFGQLDNAFHVFIDAAADGAGFTVAVAETAFTTPMVVAGHRSHFHENLWRRPGGGIKSQWGAVLTRLDREGQRVVSMYVDAPVEAELQGLRTVGDATYVLGRMQTQSGADGWDAYAAAVDSASLQLRWFTPVDVEAGDVLFDVAAAGAERLVAVGATRYTQNPSGFSISEAAPLAIFLARGDGAPGARLDIPVGPHHNELRSIVEVDPGRALRLGGFDDGPATHSAEGDPSRMSADGFLRTLRLPR